MKKSQSSVYFVLSFWMFCYGMLSVILSGFCVCMDLRIGVMLLVLAFWMFIKGYVFGTWLKLLGINTYGMFLFGMFTCALCLTSDDILLRGGWMSLIAIGLLFMGLWDMFRLGE